MEKHCSLKKIYLELNENKNIKKCIKRLGSKESGIYSPFFTKINIFLASNQILECFID